MYFKTLLTAAAATALLAGAAHAQTISPPMDQTDPANPSNATDTPPPATMPADTMSGDTAVNPPTGGAMIDPGTKTNEAAAANTMAADASATVTTSLVTNGPIADTPENRAKYGEPLSRAGKRTAARGN